MANLTKKMIEKIPLPPEGKECRVWDDKVRGLFIRVKSSGVRTYYISYRNKDKKIQRLALGRHGILSLTDARKRAIPLLAKVSAGHDPVAERKRFLEEPSFRDLAEEYMERHCSQKKSGHEDIRIIQKDILKAWESIPAHEIRRRDVIRLVDRIKDRGSPIMANRTLSVIRRIFNFGIARDIVENNPTLLVKPPSRENKRNRVLDEKEIAIFWNTLDETDIGHHIKTALRLILITAQRPGEVISMEWSEIDLDNAWWIIPEEKSKNKLPHRVPLSPMAIQLIESLDRISPFLFTARIGNRYDKKRPMTNRALPHAIRRNRDIFDLETFVPHDLRRTAASHLASQGTSRLVISKILNHIGNDVTSIYDRYSYDDQKRTALNSWSQRLSFILKGKKAKVIQFIPK